MSGKRKLKLRKMWLREHRRYYLDQALESVLNGTGTVEHMAERAMKLKEAVR